MVHKSIARPLRFHSQTLDFPSNITNWSDCTGANGPFDMYDGASSQRNRPAKSAVHRKHVGLFEIAGETAKVSRIALSVSRRVGADRKCLKTP